MESVLILNSESTVLVHGCYSRGAVIPKTRCSSYFEAAGRRLVGGRRTGWKRRQWAGAEQLFAEVLGGRTAAAAWGDFCD